MVRGMNIRGGIAAAVLAVAGGSASADNGNVVRPDPIVGVWIGQVTQFVCDNGFVLAQFEGWQLINAGGTYATTSTAPPASGGPGFGVWRALRDGRYQARHRFVRFAPDGSVEGYTVVSKITTLAADRRSLSSEIRSERFAPDGTLQFTACASETAARVGFD